MRLLQDEHPIEYHVIEWRNSAFRNHAVLGKRKMLGGVSFDSGIAISGESKSINNTVQVGVNESQPPVSHISENTVVTNGSDFDSRSTEGKSGYGKDIKPQTVKEIKDVKKDTNFWDNIITGVMEMDPLNSILSNDNDSSDIKSGRIEFVRSIASKLKKGIRLFIGKNTQDSEMKDRQKQKKKLTQGTRPVTKEDVYEIQINSSYLLESYNKNGERSTLGK